MAPVPGAKNVANNEHIKINIFRDKRKYCAWHIEQDAGGGLNIHNIVHRITGISPDAHDPYTNNLMTYIFADLWELNYIITELVVSIWTIMLCI